MNKRIIALLLAILMLLSLAACGEKATEEESSEVSTETSQATEEKDWRKEAKYQKAESVSGSRVTAFLLGIADDRITVYFDEAEQKVYGTAIYPEALSDKEFTRYQTELLDLNKDGYADLCVPYLESDGETVSCWYYIWDSGIEDFVYDSEFVPEVEEDKESSEEPEEESSEEISDESSEESSEPEKKVATIYLSKNVGGTAEVTPIEIEYEDEFGPGDAVNAIAEETWLNFSLIYQPYGEDIYIYWGENSTLHNPPTSLNPKYGLSDSPELRWFMLDSLYVTLTEMGFKNVFYLGEDGSDLILTTTEEVTIFAGDFPYWGKDETANVVTGVPSAAVATKLLERKFYGLSDSELSISFMTESSVEGEHCYIFIVADSGEGAMNAESYFAVSDSGKVYAYDPNSQAYVPYTF